jgi:hypothetical protein
MGGSRGGAKLAIAPPRVNKFGEFYRNLTDSVPLNFKIDDCTVYRFEIFEKIKNM